MKHKHWLYSALLVVTMTGCKTSQTLVQTTQKPFSELETKGKIYSAIYQQRAGEYQALCTQAYNIARLRLDEALSQTSDKPLAIVTDLDETTFDNSFYAVEMAKKGQLYDQKTWEIWTAKGQAIPLAGSVAFFQYAASKGVHIFYITNRMESERNGTINNLKKYDFPTDEKNSTLVLRTAESSKENRRLAVSKDYQIVLLMGDSLTDFSKVFDKASESDRNASVKKLSSEFGQKFIIFPNTGYGDWESSIYNYNYKLSTEAKDSILYEAAKATP